MARNHSTQITEVGYITIVPFLLYKAHALYTRRLQNSTKCFQVHQFLLLHIQLISGDEFYCFVYFINCCSGVNAY